MIDQTNALKQDSELSDLVRGTDQLLQDELQKYSRLADAKWDLQSDDKGRPLLLLTLRDPFGFTSDRFAPDEIRNRDDFPVRVHRLVGDLLQSARRVTVPIQETVLSQQQLDGLRMAINDDHDLLAGKPRLQNQVMRINANGSFTVRDFSIEVDESAVKAAKQAVHKAGLTLKTEALAAKDRVRQAVQSLVNAHRLGHSNPPKLVLWFRLDDPKDVHLLEIADDVTDPGDGSLDGVALGAGCSVPGARSIVIYSAAPSEVHKAFEVNPGHPAIEAMINRSGRVMFPPNNWQALINEFPEIAQQLVP